MSAEKKSLYPEVFCNFMWSLFMSSGEYMNTPPLKPDASEEDYRIAIVESIKVHKALLDAFQVDVIHMRSVSFLQKYKEHIPDKLDLPFKSD